MPDIIITPSTGKLEFIDNSAQVTRRHAFTLDPNDGLLLDAPLSAAAVIAPLNVINVTVNNSNVNYPFVLAQSGETGAKNLLMDGAGGTYNPFTNTATIDISGNSATTTLASNSSQLNGQSDSYYTNITARLGYTPVNKAGDTVSGSLTVNGNFSVNGSFTAFSASNIYLTSSNLTVTDNILLMNALTPYQRYAGIQMYDSGSGTLSQFLWDGDGDYFFLTGSSVNGKIITGPDGQTNLTSNYVPKATAGYKLGNSLLYDNGTNVGIGTTSPVDLLSVQGNINVNYNSTDANYVRRTFATQHASGNRGANLWFGMVDGGGMMGMQVVNTASSVSPYNSQYIAFTTHEGGVDIDERMRISTRGNVGIGTSIPNTKLAVNGVSSFGPSSKLSMIGLDINSGGTPTYIKIVTTIPVASPSADFTVNIKGFVYGAVRNADISISWHYYLSTFYNPIAKSSGGWAPTIRLSAENGFVAIVLSSPGYWPKFYVESMYSSAYTNQYASGWSWTDADATGNPIVNVPYASNFGNGFVMLTDGNVGIGTTSPGAKLDVNGNAIITGSLTTTSTIVARNYIMATDTLYIQKGVGGYQSYITAEQTSAGTGNSFKFWNSGTATLMTIRYNGYVGIGTTNPTYQLHVNGGPTEVSGQVVAAFEKQSSTDGKIATFVNTTGSGYTSYIYIGSNPGRDWKIGKNVLNSGTTGHFQITNDLNQLRMQISAADDSITFPSSSVGIGTSSPSYKLDVGVAGSDVISVRLTPGYERVRFNTFDLLGYNDGNLWMIGNNPTNTLVLGKTWDWDNQIGIAYTPGTVGNSGGILQIGQISKNNANYTHGITRLYTNGLERITIIANGNVGIGTTTPSKLLHVHGTSGEILRLSMPSNYTAGAGPQLSFWHRGDEELASIRGVFNETGQGNRANLIFGTRTSDTLGVETKMTILHNGNVGIGTTTPAAKLHINASGSSINLLRGVTYNDSNASFNNASLEYYDTSTSDASTVTKINYNAYFNKRGTANITGYTIGNFNGSTQIDSGSVNLIWDYSSRIEIRNQATASSLVHFVADSGYVTAQGGVLGKATDRIGFFVRSQNQSALTLTNQYGIYIEDLGQSTNNYAFYSNVSAASNKYNIYAAGTANNYFAGYVGIGATSFVYGAANRGLLEVYGSSDALIALRNATANFYIQKSGNNFAMVNGGAGYMTFNTNGSDRLYIDSNGYIGIATTSILTTGGNAQLSISTNTTAVALSFGASNNDMSYIRRLSAGVYQWQTYNSGNTGQIHLQPYGGSVGIGTTSPSSTLHVNSTTSGATLLRTDGTNGTLFSVVDDLSDSLMSVNNSAGLPVLEVFADDRIVAGQYGQNDFVVRNNKVGIGTNNPLYKLDVTGSFGVNASSLDTSWPFVVSDNSSAGSRYGLNKYGSMGFNNADNYAQLQLLGSSGAYVDLTNSIGGDSNARLIYYAGSRLELTYGFSTTLTLNSTNAGIGTSSPRSGFQLNTINGSSGNEYAGLTVSATVSASRGVNIAYDATNDIGVIQSVYNGVTWKGLSLSPQGGGVGIGTIAPTATLHVVGVISGSSFSGAGTGLTGTATGLSIGGSAVSCTGNAATATTASYANNINAANSYSAVAITTTGKLEAGGNVIAGGQFSGAGTGLTGTASSLTAGAANSVAWTNVSGRPTAVSSFTNDSLYQYHRGDITSLSSSATNVVQPLGTFDGSNITNAPTSGWYNYLSSTHGSYLTSLIANLHRTADWYVGYKEGPGGTPTNPSWYKLLHSGNYTDYTVTKTGTGASGNWAITSSWATNAVTALNVGNGTITIAAGTGVGVGTTNTFTTNQSGATTVTVTNTGVTSLTTNTGLSSNVSATGAVTVTNTGVTAITTNTGLSTNASATGAVTITNTGVTSNVAGTGISVSGATGAVTITNSGVTSAVAGTGVSVSAGTGAVTFSIGQAVGTGNSPTFAGASLNGNTTVTGQLQVNNTTPTAILRLYSGGSTVWNVGVGDSSGTNFNISADFGSILINKLTGNIWISGSGINNTVLHSNSTLTAGNLSGTIPSAVLGNSTHYVGTTAIALNRGSASQTLTGVSIDGNAATVTTNANLTGDVTSTGNATTIASNAVTSVKIADSNVTLAKIVNISTGTILGNNGAGAAAPLALTSAQVAAMLSGQTMNIAGSSTSCTGNAATATTATTANALNTGNSYTGVNFTATGYLQSTVGYLRTDDSNGIEVLTTTNSAQAINVKGILIGSSYDTNPPQNEIRTSNNQSLVLNARGSGQVDIYTNDSTKVTVLNGGNVGVGTSNPGRKLDVEGIVRTRGASGSGGFEIGAATTGAAKWRIEWDSASDSLDFNWVG